MKARVHWKIGRGSGQGSWIPVEHALAAIKIGNEKWGLRTHWIEYES